MHSFSLAAAIAAGTVFVASSISLAAPVTVAYWAFPSDTPATGDNFKFNPPIAADLKANVGLAVLTTDVVQWNGSPTGTGLAQGALQYFGGSILGLISPSVPGSGLSIRGLTTPNTDLSNSNNKSITLQFDSTGFGALQLSYAERVTGTGPDNLNFSVSADGVTFSPVSSLGTTKDGTFRTRIVDLSSFSAINNDPTAYVKIQFTGGFTNSTGTIRFDNITLTAVPEPTTLGLVAVSAFGLLRRRRRYSST